MNLFLIYNKLYREAEENAVKNPVHSARWLLFQQKTLDMANHLNKKLLVSETSCSVFPTSAAQTRQLWQVTCETDPPVFTVCWRLHTSLRAGQGKNGDGRTKTLHNG